jgi:hypothetical protein
MKTLIHNLKFILHPLLFFPLAIVGQKNYVPDTSINRGSLMHAKSFEEKFSEYKLPDYNDGDHPLKLEFINADKTQKLTVFHCYGGGKNEICTFRVEFRKKSDSIPVDGVSIKDSGFKTGKGIQLGMTFESFKKKMGTKNFKTEIRNGETKIKIELDDFKDNSFLHAYNMPIYMAEFYFKNGILIIFEFGFPTP